MCASGVRISHLVRITPRTTARRQHGPTVRGDCTSTESKRLRVTCSPQWGDEAVVGDIAARLVDEGELLESREGRCLEARRCSSSSRSTRIPTNKRRSTTCRASSASTCSRQSRAAEHVRGVTRSRQVLGESPHRGAYQSGARDLTCRLVLPEFGAVTLPPPQRDDRQQLSRREQARVGKNAPMMEAIDAWELRWIARHLPVWTRPGCLRHPSVRMSLSFTNTMCTCSRNRTGSTSRFGIERIRSSSRRWSNEPATVWSDGALSSTCRCLLGRNVSARCSI